MKYILFTIIAVVFLAPAPQGAKAFENALNSQLSDLKNYQVNSTKMLSSGLPNAEQFETLKAMGVTNVIDLIPGDRTEESNLMKAMELNYHNIQVDWENPTVENFNEYVAVMKQYYSSKGSTLTHCRLNWRGAVFTYLYRVTQLNEPEEQAKLDLLAIWQPNETWQSFIDDVKAQSRR